MITTKIDKYRIKFAEINKEHGIFTQELEDFLGEEFYISPASTSIDMPGCYPGGLLCHLMSVAKYSIMINDLLPETAKVNKESIMKVVFLSQIGRVFLYTVSTNEWRAKNLGQMYEYNDLIRLSIGERSLMYATQHGVKLTEEEYQAIFYSDKDDTEKSPRMFLNPISQIIKIGSQMAIMDERSKKDAKK